MAGGNAAVQGQVRPGDVLVACSATVLKAGESMTLLSPFPLTAAATALGAGSRQRFCLALEGGRGGPVRLAGPAPSLARAARPCSLLHLPGPGPPLVQAARPCPLCACQARTAQ